MFSPEYFFCKFIVIAGRMKIPGQLLRILGKTFLGLLVLILVYFFAAFILSAIAVNNTQPCEGEIDIYILTNGVHTDIVLPIRMEEMDWSQIVKIENTIGADTSARLVAFGWGDKNFYLNTPTWSNLKFSTAFKAATGLSESALHVTFYKSLKESESCKKISISPDCYRKMSELILRSFKRDSKEEILWIPTDAVYGDNDAFYDSKGSYNIFYTCNTWANDVLKAGRQRACLWTPFDKGIFYHYKAESPRN